jgi:hypothetical protein
LRRASSEQLVVNLLTFAADFGHIASLASPRTGNDVVLNGVGLAVLGAVNPRTQLLSFPLSSKTTNLLLKNSSGVLPPEG